MLPLFLSVLFCPFSTVTGPFSKTVGLRPIYRDLLVRCPIIDIGICKTETQHMKARWRCLRLHFLGG
jgi:hypothetical protein